MADPYATLGVARTASEADIKKAYRKLAKELHPDRNKDNPKATERFSNVTNAYDLLTDKDKRARFDRGEIDGDGNPAAPFGFGSGGQHPGGFRPGGGQSDFDGAPDLGDIFEGLFSGGGNKGGGFSGGFGGFGRQTAAQGRECRLSPQRALRRCGDAGAAADHARRRQDDRPEIARRAGIGRADAAGRQGPARAGRSG